MRRSALGAVLAGTAVLTACGGSSGGTAAPVSAAAATTGAAVSTDELGDALLPASAFGEDATVVGLTLEQLGDLPALAGLPEGASVDPPLCGAALGMLTGRPDDLPTLVAEGAFTDQVRTLEVLADGPALAGPALPVDQLLATCPTVTVTAPDGSRTTAALQELDLPPLGEAAAGLQVTVTAPEGSVAALVGVVAQGSRATAAGAGRAAGAAPDTGRSPTCSPPPRTPPPTSCGRRRRPGRRPARSQRRSSTTWPSGSSSPSSSKSTTPLHSRVQPCSGWPADRDGEHAVVRGGGGAGQTWAHIRSTPVRRARRPGTGT